jgi:hypothetical protein
MSLVEDVRASFKAKGLTFVSLTESNEDPEKTTLTYTDGSGKTVRKDVKTRLEMLEDMVEDLDRMDMDPTGLANFLLEDSV